MEFLKRLEFIRQIEYNDDNGFLILVVDNASHNLSPLILQQIEAHYVKFNIH